MEIKFIDKPSDNNLATILVVKCKNANNKELILPNSTKDIEKNTNIVISDIIKAQNYEGEYGEVLVIPTAKKNPANIVLISLGNQTNANTIDQLKIGGKIYDSLQQCKAYSASLYFPSEDNKHSEDEQHMPLNILLGILTKSFYFDQYLTKKKDDFLKVQSIDAALTNSDQLKAEFEKINAIYQGCAFTKTLVSEPGNVLTPENFASRCQELSKLGLKVEILNEEEMASLNMNALLGVARGSRNKPKLVVMRWEGSQDSNETLAFIGKGVTFDTGGLSLKPANAMIGMKYDMAGAAVVAGLMKTLALRKAKVNVVGVLGLVENMPGGNAQRPEDIVKTMSGQTVEVLNTDAEGRLVLADALWYTQDKFKPKFMINLATLTGAMVITLADQYAGIFSNDDQLVQKLCDAGYKTGEKLWRLPLDKEYDKMIDSKIADMQNISTGRGAGSITAAQFLQRFVNNVPWAHLDIAGVTDSSKKSDLNQAGATGFGVRVLNQFLEDYYEKK